MTAEIVIMNKHGVALAADSAVSIGSNKVYNSANKLFSLSKIHPIGIMIYGSAMFMGIPWETIIKKYRNEILRDQYFGTLQEHTDHFLDYLVSPSIISEKTEDHFLKTRFWRIADRLVQKFKNDLKRMFEEATSPINETSVKDRLSKWILETQDKIKDHAPIDGITSQEKDAITHKFDSFFNEILDRCLESLPVSEKNRNDLQEIVFKLMFSKIDLGENSGIVIAGYGADEIFPKREDVSLGGKIGNNLIIEKRSQEQIRIGMGASIAPYAQREMVDTIMKGIDPQLESEIRDLVKDALDKLPVILANRHGIELNDEAREKITQDVAAVYMELDKSIDMAQRDYYIRPIIDSVGTLPPAELGAMAETLISITSFKRRVTMVSESVGGPIDVALITRGDGFVWIKRKHYFEPQLNHQYFANQTRMTHEFGCQ